MGRPASSCRLPRQALDFPRAWLVSLSPGASFSEPCTMLGVIPRDEETPWMLLDRGSQVVWRVGGEGGC